MDKNINFENSLNRIIEISNQLENEELNLEEAINFYKEAMDLINNCQKEINNAERLIYIYRESILETEDEKEVNEIEGENDTENEQKKEISSNGESCNEMVMGERLPDNNEDNDNSQRVKSKKKIKIKNNNDAEFSFDLFQDISDQENDD